GTFQPEQRLQVGDFPAFIATGDFDNDGRLDIASAIYYGNVTSVFLNTSAAPPISVVSAANFTATLAPEMLASIFAVHFRKRSEEANSQPPPFPLGGTTVKVQDSAGVTRDAPLYYVSPSQINLEVPAGTASGQGSVTITTDSGASTTGPILIRPVAPGLFTA